MSRANMEDNKFINPWIKQGLKFDSLILAISGAFTVNANMPTVIELDPTGAQNVTFPTKGSRFTFIIAHKGTNAVNLTLKDSTGTTIGTVGQSKSALVVDDGNITFAIVSA